MKESEGEEESEPEEDPEEDPGEEGDKSKEISDAQPTGASIDCPSINSRNPSQPSELSSSTHSFHSSDMSRVWSSSSAPSQ
ncbi:hypothetical protein PIB30_044913 [Stylosanthes scabra]|uniref:Uncharacterized protein n=1 Tax=Stylosanthes scabra TaxID=79078 RepID=A0ABU6WEG4_9FABA|nr:hypothetical protein [Stylosanthes scabra]